MDVGGEARSAHRTSLLSRVLGMLEERGLGVRRQPL
jgi:hypothetical protein